MKKALIILINLIVLFQVYGQKFSKEFWESMEDTIVESHIVDIDFDGFLDTLIFRYPSNYKHPDFEYSDPGVCNILDIKLSNTDNVLIRDFFDTISQKPFKEFSNDINSKLVYFSDFNSSDRYLFLNCLPSGCCINKLYIFKIIDNQLKLIGTTNLILRLITDYDKNGDIEIIGNDRHGEGWGKDYQEFQTLVFPKVFKITDTVIMDTNLTYSYNSELKEKYGDFLSFKAPVIVTNMSDFTENLEDYNNIKGKYYRKYNFVSDTKLKGNALDKYSKIQLRLMRNEIFAAHGYIFKSDDLREYFEKTKWYNPRFADVTDKLTEIEKYNIKLILEKENNN